MPSNNQRNNELEFTPTFGTQHHHDATIISTIFEQEVRDRGIDGNVCDDDNNIGIMLTDQIKLQICQI